MSETFYKTVKYATITFVHPSGAFAFAEAPCWKNQPDKFFIHESNLRIPG
jgi:hypothetical protein